MAGLAPKRRLIEAADSWLAAVKLTLAEMQDRR
jgi:hypothetical protein